MAVGETTVTVVGILASEVTKRRVNNGREVATFWLRSSERRYNKEKAEWIDGRHLSIKVTCWRKLASSTHASLRKGDSVVVVGRLYTNEYDSDRERNSRTELDALALGPNLNWCSATLQRPVNRRDAHDDTVSTNI